MNEILTNWQSYCTDELYLGEGTTRIAYRVGNYVIKKHLHEIGHKQSLNERQVYLRLRGTKFEPYLAATYHVEKEFAISQYVPPLDGDFSLDCFDPAYAPSGIAFPELYDEFIDTIIDEGVEDYWHSSNYGLNEQKEFVLLDYGMSHSLFTEFLEANRKGEIPNFVTEICYECGLDFVVKILNNEPIPDMCPECSERANQTEKVMD